MPALGGGGAERTLVNLFKKIDFDRYKVDLIIVSGNGIYINEVPDEVKTISLFKNDFLVRVLAYVQKRTGFIWFFQLMMNWKVKREYDVAISFQDSNFTNLLFFIKARRRIAWIHSSYRSNENFASFFANPAYLQKTKHSRYDRLDDLVFVSNDAKKEFEAIFGTYDNSSVIYNIIDSEMVKQKANLVQSNFHKSEEFVFFAMGSLKKVKGFDRLVRSAALLKKEGLKFKLKIAGDGIEKKNLLQLIHSLDLKEEIELLGFLKNPYFHFKQSDAFILSSVSEALPTVICEAMILGKPIISTECSGASELLENNKYGLLAKQSDEDLALKMKTFLEDTDLVEYYRQKALEGSEKFNDDKTLIEYYNLFDKIAE